VDLRELTPRQRTAVLEGLAPEKGVSFDELLLAWELQVGGKADLVYKALKELPLTDPHRVAALKALESVDKATPGLDPVSYREDGFDGKSRPEPTVDHDPYLH